MKRVLVLLLSALFLLSFAGCKGKEDDKNGIPEDFAFSLTWNTHGVSSYDSKTGTLVKTTDADEPSDFVTQYILTDKDREYIYNLIKSLDISSYPDEYNPGNGISFPSMTFILTVTQNGETKRVAAKGISFSLTSEDEKGQAFLTVCHEISNRLMSTDEWKALPEYEVLYA